MSRAGRIAGSPPARPASPPRGPRPTSSVAAGRSAGAGVDDTPFGSLRSTPVNVIASDGVPLHVEVDELEGPEVWGTTSRRGRRKPREAPPLTVVFVHGFALNLDCWHFQRAAYRGLVRTVFYDQRSHGRSGRSAADNATIEQLGKDLLAVLDAVAPDGPVVLVGHSMGGMTIVALAEEHPELFGDRIVGVGPDLHDRRRSGAEPDPAADDPREAHRRRHPAGGPHPGPRAPHHRRRCGAPGGPWRWSRPTCSRSATRCRRRTSTSWTRCCRPPRSRWWPSSSRASAPSTSSTRWSRCRGCPTTVICGTDDRITSIGHSRKLHDRIAGSTLLECEDAGHMVILERHDQVNAALDQLISAAAERVGAR